MHDFVFIVKEMKYLFEQEKKAPFEIESNSICEADNS